MLDFDGISQSIGNEADEARFTFGNADRVMRDLANDVDLFRASIEFSLFHVGTGIKLDLWKGEVVNWEMDSGPEFQVTAAAGLYELNLPYPTRRISRQCWKDFDDSQACPFASQSTGMDLTHFPNADRKSCDKGYDSPNGCLAHGMKRFFGGVLAEPQGVRIKDNTTGTWGFGRSSITSVSLVAESIYDEVVPEIYTDSAMPVNCKIAAGRDESDFYEALGIVGEGPLGSYATPGSLDDFGNQVGHKLDGQLHHGYPGSLGLRTYLGTDPAGSTDFFSLDQGGDQTGGDWRKVFSGGSTYKDNFAAGLAFIVIRKSDAKGLQLSQPGDHQMRAVVAQGMSGWVWTAPGERSPQVLTNPIWIVINMLLRARGLRFADAETAEQYFDVDACIAAASICDAGGRRPGRDHHAGRGFLPQRPDLNAEEQPADLGGNLYLRTASDKFVFGLTATQLRDELNVYSKTQVDSLLAGKANAGHTHGISLYTGTAGDPPHEHLVERTTGIEQ